MRRHSVHVRRAVWVWGPAVVLMMLIFLVSDISEPPQTSGLSAANAHGIVYAVLGALMLRGVAGGRWDRVTIRSTVGAVALTAAYGITDEWHQSFVPARMAELQDLMADTVGAVIGVMIVWAWSIVVHRGSDAIRTSHRRAE